jgi:hypothetical protein
MDVELGPPRQWPTVTQQARVIPVVWRMTGAQFAAFDAWVHRHLRGGALPFDVPLADGRASPWWTVHLLDGYEAPFASGYRIEVSAKLYAIGPAFASRSDDVSFTAALLGGLRLRTNGTQELLFTADLAGALSIEAVASLNAAVAFEALLDGELTAEAIGTEVEGGGGTFYRLTEAGDRRITEAGDPRRTE